MTSPNNNRQHQNDPRFKSLVAAAEVSLDSFFEVAMSFNKGQFDDQGELLVRKARVVLGFRIEEEGEAVHVLDLKTGPAPVIVRRANSAAAGTPIPDVTIVIDTKRRFVSLLKQEENGMDAFRTGGIKVQGSINSLLKLRALQPLMEQWKDDFASAASGGAEAAIPDGDQFNGYTVKEGYLEKRSEWLGAFRNRYFHLRWNSTTRPQLRIYQSLAAHKSGLPPKIFMELHSGVRVYASDDDVGNFGFVIHDTRTGKKVKVRAASERAMRQWLASLEEAIHARSRALGTAHDALNVSTLSSTPKPGGGGGGNSHGAPPPPVGLLELILTAQRVTSAHAEMLRKNEEQLRAISDSQIMAEEHLVSRSLESDFVTIKRWLGWWWVPLGAVTGLTVKLGHAIVSGVWGAFYSRFGRPGVILLLALLTWFSKQFHESPSFELARRRWEVQTLALSVIYRLKLASIRAESGRMPQLHKDAMWNTELRLQAERLYALSLNLRGLWVKTAQFLGARPDVVPPAAIAVLKRLHDAVPATPFAEVKRTVEGELGRPLATTFAEFEEDVLASASIGQVHRAVLMETGEEVVVKVQHPNVEPKIRQDLENMRQIMRLVEFLQPDFEMRPIVEEWSREVLKELDFTTERANMVEVGANLAKDPTIYAALPRPIEGMCSPRVLAMRFVLGAKINELEALKRVAGVHTVTQREGIASDICTAFAKMLFVDGVFNADPHPGNILICSRAGLAEGAVISLPSPPPTDPDRPVPVLLDFGLTKRLPSSKRIAFSRLVCAMEALDVGALLYAFDEMGLRLKRDDPFEDLTGFRFAFRNTESGEESRAVTLKHIEKQRAKYEALPVSERNPVEAFPSELMLFFRTIFLLRGLCTSLEVRHKYLKTMAAFAKRAMLERFAAHPSAPLDAGDVAPAYAQLQSRVVNKLRAMDFASSGFVGCQVYCTSTSSQGCVMLDFAAGTLANLDPRPLSRRTLIPSLSLAQGIAQIAVANACAEELDAPLASLWPAFARVSKTCTLRQLLSGETRDLPFSPSALPRKYFLGSMDKDLKGKLEFVAHGEEEDEGEGATMIRGGESSAIIQPGTDADTSNVSSELPWELSTLAFSWGWALVGAMEGKRAGGGAETEPAGTRYLKAVEAVKKTISGCAPEDLAVRLPESDTLPVPFSTKKYSQEEVDKQEELRAKERDRVAQKYATLCIDLEKLSGGTSDRIWDLQEEIQNGGGASLATGAGAGGFDMGAFLRSIPSIKGREYFVDPRIFNIPSARSSVLPNANLLSTAEAIAKVYAEVARRETGGLRPEACDIFLSQLGVGEALDSRAEPLGERLGVSVFEIRHAHTKNVVRGFGQVAFGGSTVLCVPALGFSLCVLVNGLTMERAVAKAVIEEVLKSCDDGQWSLLSEI